MIYAGDVLPQQCWEGLSKESLSQLVDVRTCAEWQFVGIPNLSQVPQETIFLEWQKFPHMDVNVEFVDVLQNILSQRQVGKNTALYFLCRSGQRGQSAAIAMAKAGYAKAYNITGGFEGSLNANGHRVNSGGWKFSGLDWIQS